MTRPSPTAVDGPPRVRIGRTGPVAVVALEDERRRNVLGRGLRTRLQTAPAELAGCAPLAAVKQGIREASGSPAEALAFERDHQPALFGTSGFLAGKQPFFEKRVPSFSGR